MPKRNFHCSPSPHLWLWNAGLQDHLQIRTYVRRNPSAHPPIFTNTCSPGASHPRSRAERAVRSLWPVRSCCSRTTTTSTGRSTRTNPARADRRSTGSPIGQRVSGHACTILIARLSAVDRHGYAPENRRRRHKRACALSSTPRQRQPGTRCQQERAAHRRPVSKNRRRPTLPGPCEPSTIGAEGLNCSVRNGKRCFPLAIATGKRRETEEPSSVLQNCTAPQRVSLRSLHWERIKKIRQALDQLVPVSCGRYRPSRSGLSTWWSTRGLTPSRGWESSSRGRLPA